MANPHDIQNAIKSKYVEGIEESKLIADVVLALGVKDVKVRNQINAFVSSNRLKRVGTHLEIADDQKIKNLEHSIEQLQIEKQSLQSQLDGKNNELILLQQSLDVAGTQHVSEIESLKQQILEANGKSEKERIVYRIVPMEQSKFDELQEWRKSQKNSKTIQ